MPTINPIIQVSGGGGGINYTVDVFTSSGTWTKPANLDYSYVLMVSGGSGGGSGRRGASSTNRGGGRAVNGRVMLAKFLETELSSTETVTVGAGGSGGAARTSDNLNGLSGSAGGDTRFKYGTDFRILSQTATGGSTSIINSITNSAYSGSVVGNRPAVISIHSNPRLLGATLPSDIDRGNGVSTFGPVNITDNASAGGQIRSTNVQVNAGQLGGFYDSSNTLTGATSGTAPETAAVQPTVFMTFGKFLNKIFPWFDESDANYNIGRCGLGGGCSQTVSVPDGIAGQAGANGVGYGGGGGGGGASVNGLNSGAGGDGTGGIVIVINVLTS